MSLDTKNNSSIKTARRVNKDCKVCDEKYLLGCLDGCERVKGDFIIHSITFKDKQGHIYNMKIDRCDRKDCRTIFRFGCADEAHPGHYNDMRELLIINSSTMIGFDYSEIKTDNDIKFATRRNKTCTVCEQKNLFGCFQGCESGDYNFVKSESGSIANILFHSITYKINKTVTREIIPRCNECKNKYEFGCFDEQHPNKIGNMFHIIDERIGAKILGFEYREIKKEKLDIKRIDNNSEILIVEKIDNKNVITCESTTSFNKLIKYFKALQTFNEKYKLDLLFDDVDENKYKCVILTEDTFNLLLKIGKEFENIISMMDTHFK
jgi:hypothetical protein